MGINVEIPFVNNSINTIPAVHMSLTVVYWFDAIVSGGKRFLSKPNYENSIVRY